MKRIISIAMLAVLCVFTTTSYAVFVHQDDYEDRTIGATCEGWLWTGNALTTHVGVYASHDGSIVREHTGTVADTTATTNGRYGYKAGLAMTGNTSADPADYTVSFDIRNLSGDWTTIPFSIAIVSMPENFGHTYDNISVSQAAGWVHVEFNLADYDGDWWNGAGWDLLKPTWDIEVGFPVQAVAEGASWTQVFLVDNLKILMGAVTEPFDPTYDPTNDDGTVGDLVLKKAKFKLKWKAGGDPNYTAGYRVNPNIKGHYVYLSTGNPADPNINYLTYVAQVQNADPNLTDPNNTTSYYSRTADTTYYWKVEEAMNDGTGNPYPKGNENNIMGPVWSFKTISLTPKILVHPESALIDASGNASFSAKGSASATHYRWYKVVGVVGGGDDVEKGEGEFLDSTKITTWNITGATQADEGLYYCIVYYGNPDVTEEYASAPSNTAKLWYPRLVSHYPFETMTGTITPDIISGFDAEVKQEGSAGLPVLNSTDAIVGSSCLELDNGDTDPNGQYAQLLVGAVDYKDITISVWVYPKTASGWERIYDFGNGETDYMFLSPAGPGVLRFATRVDNGTEQLLSGTALAVDQWYQATVTITGDTGRLYRNGELVETNTAMTVNPIDIGAALNYLGKSQYTADPEFDGLIDDLKIYNYARSTVEIAQDYIAVAGGSVCNRETYDMGNYDTNNDCIINLTDFVSFAARWLEDDRIY